MLAKDKSKIIENLNTIETLNFEFVQISYDKKEKGISDIKHVFHQLRRVLPIKLLYKG